MTKKIIYEINSGDCHSWACINIDKESSPSDHVLKLSFPPEFWVSRSPVSPEEKENNPLVGDVMIMFPKSEKQKLIQVLNSAIKLLNHTAN